MTRNHDYSTPSKGATDWHVPMNENFSALDRDVPIWDADANKSNYAPLDGAHFIATDTGFTYEGNGNVWEKIGSINREGPNADVQLTMGRTDIGDIYGSQYNVNEENAGFTSDESYVGSQSLVHELQPGEHWGARTVYDFLEDGEFGYAQPDEVYSRIYVKFENEWEQADSSTTCKIYYAGVNFHAGDGGNGGGQPTGDDGWSVRVYTRGPSDDGTLTLATYAYHLDQDGEYGDGWDWPDEAPIGEWNQIDTYIKLNSVLDGEAKRNGQVRFWLNGELQDEHTDLRWRTTESMGFGQIGPNTYWGGDETSPRSNKIYFDRHSISVGQKGL